MKKERKRNHFTLQMRKLSQGQQGLAHTWVIDRAELSKHGMGCGWHQGTIYEPDAE